MSYDLNCLNVWEVKVMGKKAYTPSKSPGSSLTHLTLIHIQTVGEFWYVIVIVYEVV